MDFRLCITKIASVQKTCGIDPKVLARMIYNGSSWCEPTVAPETLIEYFGRASVCYGEKRCWCELGSQGVEASTYPGDRGEAQLQNEPVFAYEILLSWLNSLFMKGSSLCSVGWATCDLTTCAGGREAPHQLDPIQAPVPRMPWLSYVDESGSRCVDDLRVERRE